MRWITCAHDSDISYFFFDNSRTQKIPQSTTNPSLWLQIVSIILVAIVASGIVAFRRRATYLIRLFPTLFRTFIFRIFRR
jgi:tellurite resistance protein TehA-like permease